MKTFKLFLFGIAVFAAILIGINAHSTAIVLGGFLALMFASQLLTKPSANVCTVTLSVPEILMDVMDAFKLELFPTSRFSTDYSSKTAVKGDKITAHISILPVAADYDPTTGFLNGVQNAEGLLQDVSVTLDTFKHVPIRVKYLSQLGSKVPLYREAIRNTGYALAKTVLDAALAQVLIANFTTGEPIPLANFSLDSMEVIRTDLNTNKAANMGRFGILNSVYAAQLQADDRVKSSLFYAQLNGDRGYRVFKNIAGFSEVIEYPDLPNNNENLSGFFGDPRAVVIANRQVDFANAAVELNVPQIMEFIPLQDEETGLTLTGVGWQQPGTGDVIFSAAVLFGVAAGNQGGTANTAGDKAGVRLTTQ